MVLTFFFLFFFMKPNYFNALFCKICFFPSRNVVENVKMFDEFRLRRRMHEKKNIYMKMTFSRLQKKVRFVFSVFYNHFACYSYMSKKLKKKKSISITFLEIWRNFFSYNFFSGSCILGRKIKNDGAKSEFTRSTVRRV